MNIKSEIFQIPKGWKLEPYTIVNLLGKYGDFEVGSGGIADGWGLVSSGTVSLETGIINNSAQRLYYDNTGGSSSYYAFLRRHLNINSFTSGEKLFVIGYIKTTSNDTTTSKGGVELIFFNLGAAEAILSLTEYGANFASNWLFKYGVLTVPTTFDDIQLRLMRIVDIGTIGEIYFDGVAVYNLTAMGALPYGLQQYFAPSGIIKWEDLATPNDIEAIDERVQSGEDWLAELLPYVNGIASLGFAWEGI